MSDFCKHWHGVQSIDPCTAGQDFKSYLKQQSGQLGSPEVVPCFSRLASIKCPAAVYMTDEEIKAEEEELASFLKHMNDCSAKWVCFRCGADIQFEEQVGRCAYARPCGCRLYQGTARGKRPLSIDTNE